MFDLQAKDVLELGTIVVGLVSHAWYLGARIQKIEDAGQYQSGLLRRHMNEDRQDFQRIYDKLDRKADKPAALQTIA